MTNSDNELREKLAAIEHERWADWQQWVHAVYANQTQPFEKAIENWKKQIATPYSELSDREKASDMEQVDRYWPLLMEWHQKEIKAAVREATQRCHDAMFPYEPDEPCPYCMCEAESIQHEALIECQEQLKQEGINPQREGRNG